MKEENKNYFVYVTSYVGNLGTKILIEKKIEDLRRHYSGEYIEKVLADCGSVPLFNLEKADDIIDVEEIKNGGVLASLWKICDRNKLGLRYRLCDIPLYQGTIEISNYFDINPYRLLTSGSYIVISKNKNKKNMYLIGTTNDKKQRLRVDGEVDAFLTKYYKDELDKICR